MSDETCIFHPDQKAVGHCGKCANSFCDLCLIQVGGRSLCRNCMESPKPSGSPGPASGASGSFKDLDDLLMDPGTSDGDPLGILGTKAPASPTAMKPAGPDPPSFGVTPLFKPDFPAVPPPKLDVPVSPFRADGIQKPAGSDRTALPSTPPSPSALPGPRSSAPDFTKSVPAFGTAAPSFSRSAPALGGFGGALGQAATADSVPLRPISSFGLKQEVKNTPPLVVFWWRFEKAVKPIARLTRLPVAVLAVVAGILVLATVLVPFLFLRKPSVRTLDTVPPIHVVKVQVSQVGELDITTYLELENKLKELGFDPLLQMTISQAPSPNFIAAFVKDSAGTYAELLKLPGSLTPKVSYVTVFNNGVWCSTNGWEGKDVQDEYLMSAHYPSDFLDQLYVKHMQRLEQFRKENGWVPQRMSENRYVTALTDHFRWFLSKKKIPSYKASFDLWH